MLDTPEFSIHSSLMKCIQFINRVRDVGGVVLVHCNAGVSRAPTVVVAYCMQQMRVPYNEAFDFVKQKRTFIRPNEGFVKQLKSFE
ncbi:Dual specificity phosphatase catalytic domain, partial [Trinorchestia longiramus]